MRAVLLAIVIAVLVRFVDFNALGAALSRVSLALFALCVGLDLALVAIDSWRVEALSGFEYRFGPSFRARLVSLLFGNVLPGTAGSEVVRFLLLDRQRPGRRTFLVLLLLANRMYGFLGLPALLLFALLSPASDLSTRLGLPRGILAAAAAAALLSPMSFALRPVRGLAARAVSSFRGRAGHFARRVYWALRRFSSPKLWAAATASSIIGNFVGLLQMWLLGSYLGAQATVAEWAVIVPTMVLAAFIPAGFGAIGPQDAALASAARLLGRPIEPFLAASIVLHGVRLVTSIGGMVFLGETKKILGSSSVLTLAALLRRAGGGERRA